MQDLPRSLSPFRHGSGFVADVTGNLHRVGDSVILQIDDSSSAAYSSSSDCERHRRRSMGIGRMDSQDIDNEYEDDDEEEEEEDAEEEEDDEQLDDEEASDYEEELHCDDWEIRMLAAEMERREHSKDEGQGHSHQHHQEGGIRRRRKRSDAEEATTTATEQSEQEAEQPGGHRPRASSLDQNKSSRRRGFFKALSFDRDKDRL